MPATVTTSTLVSTITQNSLGDAIKAALIAAGLSAVDDYVASSSRQLVFSYTIDATQTYGVTYYKVRIDSSLIVYGQIMSGWNTSTKVATNGSGEYNNGTISSSASVTFTSIFLTGEVNLCVITNGTLLFTLGMVFPATRPSWWSLNFWAYGFHFTSATHLTMRGCSNNPYGSTEYSTSLGNQYLAYQNDYSRGVDTVGKIILYSQSGKGVAGITSESLITGAFYGIPALSYDSFPGSTNSYLILAGGAGALAIQVS